jgi:hypothetical protein
MQYPHGFQCGGVAVGYGVEFNLLLPLDKLPAAILDEGIYFF